MHPRNILCSWSGFPVEHQSMSLGDSCRLKQHSCSVTPGNFRIPVQGGRAPQGRDHRCEGPEQGSRVDTWECEVLWAGQGDTGSRRCEVFVRLARRWLCAECTFILTPALAGRAPCYSSTPIYFIDGSRRRYLLTVTQLGGGLGRHSLLPSLPSPGGSAPPCGAVRRRVNCGLNLPFCLGA